MKVEEVDCACVLKVDDVNWACGLWVSRFYRKSRSYANTQRTP